MAIFFFLLTLFSVWIAELKTRVICYCVHSTGYKIFSLGTGVPRHSAEGNYGNGTYVTYVLLVASANSYTHPHDIDKPHVW